MDPITVASRVVAEKRPTFRHYRLPDPRYCHPVPAAQGGVTLAFRIQDHGDMKVLSVAGATCSLTDNYCKETGRHLAHARLAGFAPPSAQLVLHPRQCPDEVLHDYACRLSWDYLGTVDLMLKGDWPTPKDLLRSLSMEQLART